MSGQQLKKTWGAPALLGALILFGLLSALLGTGLWSFFSWVAMIVPLLVIIWKVWSTSMLSKNK